MFVPTDGRTYAVQVTHAAPNTRHEVTAPRVAGPSGRTFVNKAGRTFVNKAGRTSVNKAGRTVS